MIECSRCMGQFEESATLMGADGPVCEACHAEAEAPDVGKLLQRDELKLGVGLIALGVVLLGAGAYLARVVWAGMEARAALAQQGVSLSGGGRGIAYVLLALAAGVVALASGVWKIWKARRP